MRHRLHMTLLVLRFTLWSSVSIWTKPTTIRLANEGKVMIVRFDNFVFPDEGVPDLPDDFWITIPSHKWRTK